MQPEDVEPPPKRRRARRRRSASPPCRAKARSRSVELVPELVAVRVSVRAEPLPDRGQPPPVGLGRVRAPRGGRRRRPRGRRRRASSTSPTTPRARGRRGAGARARRRLPRSTASRTVSGPAFGFPSRSPPIQRAEAERDAGQPRLPDRDEVGGGVPEALLEEPEALPDLVDHARALGADLVGLPEDRDLLRERSPRASARSPRCRGAGRRARRGALPIRRCFSRIVRGSASVGCAVRTSSTDTAAAARELVLADARARERLERLVERLAQRPALALDLAPRAGRGGAARRCSRGGSRS